MLEVQQNVVFRGRGPVLAAILGRQVVEVFTATREHSCLPQPTNDEEHYLTEAQTALDIVRQAIAQALPNPQPISATSQKTS